MNKLTHITGHEKLDLARKYPQPADQFKPVGFWYGINDDWLEWIYYNMPEWIRPKQYEITLNYSRICVIEDIASLKRFKAKYGVKDGRFDWLINWSRVRQDFDGVEIRNFQRLKNTSFGYLNMWLYSWDCDSGCVWNLSAIESHKLTDIDKKYLTPIEDD